MRAHQWEVVMRCRPSLPEAAVPPEVAGRGRTWCRAPAALPLIDEDRQMGGVSNSMAVVAPAGSPKTGGLLLTACVHSIVGVEQGGV